MVYVLMKFITTIHAREESLESSGGVGIEDILGDVCDENCTCHN